MKRKFILFVTVFVILVNLFSVSAFAETVPTVTVGTATGEVGDTVEITVRISNNTGFADLGIEVGYNSEIMTLTGASANSEVGANFTAAQSYAANPYNMGWSGVSDITYNGNLVTLTFKIAENAKSGTYPITVDYYKGRNGNYKDGDDVNYDADYDPLNLKYVNGSITVKGAAANSSISVSGISFSVSLDGDTSTGNVWAAIYASDGKLKDVKQYPAAKTVNVAFDKGVTGAYVKIMWWDDNMQPMCEAQTIPLQ